MKERFSIDRANFPGPVLVTGAGGCVGGWVLARLVRAGVPACALDLSEDKRRPRLLIDEADLQKIAWRTGDVSESRVIVEALEALRPCAVIHLAALQVPFCKADPVAGAKVNVVGTVNVFEAARRLGIRRIAYASSIAAYGAMDEGHGAMHTLYGAAPRISHAPSRRAASRPAGKLWKHAARRRHPRDLRCVPVAHPARAAEHARVGLVPMKQPETALIVGAGSGLSASLARLLA